MLEIEVSEKGLKSLKKIGLILLISIAIIFFLDLITPFPCYELQPAVIQKVKKSNRYIGYDNVTWVKFKDGYVEDIGGDRGKPGEEILAHRKVGIQSLFGIIGKKSILFD